VAGSDTHEHQKSMKRKLEVGSGGQLSLADDPTIRQPDFNLPRQQWSLLDHFRTAQGHCGACKKKRNQAAADLCPCGEKQTMSHIVDSCPLSKLNGGLSQIHSADDKAAAWLNSYSY